MPLFTSPRAVPLLFALLGYCFLPALQAAPEIETWETANGAKVLFVAAPDLPMLDVRVVFDAGSARDGDRSGLPRARRSRSSSKPGAWSCRPRPTVSLKNTKR